MLCVTLTHGHFWCTKDKHKMRVNTIKKGVNYITDVKKTTTKMSFPQDST